jgi:hypothetical protein
MGNITITAASVVASSGALVATGSAGAAITAGQPIAKYQTATQERRHQQPAQATSSTAGWVHGIALTNSASDQPYRYIKEGTLTLDTCVKGKVYCVSTDAGRIFSATDLTTTGTFVAVVGIGTASNRMQVKIARNPWSKLP